MPMPKCLPGKTEPLSNRFGAVIANVLSVGTRGLGYFLWGLLRIIYRGDLKMIALFGAVIGAIALLIWLIAG
jgi:hypothetical protein